MHKGKAQSYPWGLHQAVCLRTNPKNIGFSPILQLLCVTINWNIGWYLLKKDVADCARQVLQCRNAINVRSTFAATTIKTVL